MRILGMFSPRGKDVMTAAVILSMILNMKNRMFALEKEAGVTPNATKIAFLLEEAYLQNGKMSEGELTKRYIRPLLTMSIREADTLRKENSYEAAKHILADTGKIASKAGFEDVKKDSNAMQERVEMDRVLWNHERGNKTEADEQREKQIYARILDAVISAVGVGKPTPYDGKEYVAFYVGATNTDTAIHIAQLKCKQKFGQRSRSAEQVMTKFDNTPGSVKGYVLFELK